MATCGTEDRVHDLAATGTDEPGETYNLAGSHRERHSTNPGCDQICHGQDRIADGGGGRLFGEHGTERPTEHRLDEARLGLVGCGAGADETTVAQHGDVVGELEHLAEEVRDENHSVAGCRELAHDGVQQVGIRPDSAAVGSSMMMTDAPRASARMISTFCWSAVRNAPTGVSAGRSNPVRSLKVRY